MINIVGVNFYKQIIYIVIANIPNHQLSHFYSLAF